MLYVASAEVRKGSGREGRGHVRAPPQLSDRVTAIVHQSEDVFTRPHAACPRTAQLSEPPMIGF